MKDWIRRIIPVGRIMIIVAAAVLGVSMFTVPAFSGGHGGGHGGGHSFGHQGHGRYVRPAGYHYGYRHGHYGYYGSVAYYRPYGYYYYPVPVYAPPPVVYAPPPPAGISFVFPVRIH